MERRPLLKWVGAAVGVVTAGCQSEANDGSLIEVKVLSVSDEAVTLTLEIAADQEGILTNQYDLKPGEAGQTRTVSRVPDTVHIDVTGEESFSWNYDPPRECELSGDDPEIIITVYGPSDVELSNGCGS